jgi:HSP20 family molecular chaperone IbpA
MDDPQKPSTRDRDYARLAPLLKRLVNALRRIASDDGPLPAGQRDHEGHIYLEFDLPGVVGSDVDISIHEGRAFIRIER